MLIKSRLMQTIILSLYIGGLYYYAAGDYSINSVWRSISGFCFFISISSMMSSLSPVTLVFPQ